MSERKEKDYWLDMWSSIDMHLWWIDQDDLPTLILGAHILDLCLFPSGKAKIWGYLPQAIVLNGVTNGTSLEVLYKECGPYDLYRRDEVILRLDNVRIEKKTLGGILPADILHTDQVAIVYLEITCDVTIIQQPTEGEV